MLSIAKSRYTLALQSTFTALNAVGVALAATYNAKTPDLYPNNSHHKIGWIITLVFSVHVLVNFIGRAANKWRSRTARNSSNEEHPFLPTTRQDSSFTQSGYYTPNPLTTNDGGSSSDTEPSSSRNSSVSTICAEDAHLGGEHHKEFRNDDDEFEDVSILSSRHTKAALASTFDRCFSGSAIKCVDIGYKVVDRIILPFGFIALVTGVATFAGFFVCYFILNLICFPSQCSDIIFFIYRKVIAFLEVSLIGLKVACSSGLDYSILDDGRVVLLTSVGLGICVLKLPLGRSESSGPLPS